MTRTEILALAGRDLDAAVAEKVFGWEPVPDGTVIGLRGKGWYRHADEPGAYVCGFDEYSTDANAARLVLAEIERRLGDVTPFIDAMDFLLDYPQNRGYHPEHCEWMLMSAPPDAICRAALLACLPEGGE